MPFLPTTARAFNVRLTAAEARKPPRCFALHERLQCLVHNRGFVRQTSVSLSSSQ